jgi:hypothetical protein
MNRNIPLLFLLTLLSLSSAAGMSPCGKSGMTALRANDGGGFLFYLFREEPDIYFSLDGKQISFPEGTNGPRRFMIDGIFYESLTLKPKEFIESEKGLADLDILKRHQQYEFGYMKTTPTPLKEFVELGPRTKPAAAGQPSFTFYLWMARAPNDAKGTRQYFLTTVSNSEVIVLTAIVPNEAAEVQAMQSFQSYAGSFQHVLRKEDCPSK